MNSKIGRENISKMPAFRVFWIYSKSFLSNTTCLFLRTSFYSKVSKVLVCWMFLHRNTSLPHPNCDRSKFQKCNNYWDLMISSLRLFRTFWLILVRQGLTDSFSVFGQISGCFKCVGIVINWTAQKLPFLYNFLDFLQKSMLGFSLKIAIHPILLALETKRLETKIFGLFSQSELW